MSIDFEPDAAPTAIAFEPDEPTSGSIAFEPDEPVQDPANVPSTPLEKYTPEQEERFGVMGYLEAAPGAARRSMPAISVDPGATDYTGKKYEGSGINPTEIDPMRTPAITFPESMRPEEKGLVPGAIRGAQNVVEGLTTPENMMLLGTLGGAPSAIQKIVGGGFAAQMAQGFAEGGFATKRAYEAGDMDAVGESGATALASGIMAGLAGMHATGRPSITPEIKARRAAVVAPLKKAGFDLTSDVIFNDPEMANALAEVRKITDPEGTPAVVAESAPEIVPAAPEPVSPPAPAPVVEPVTPPEAVTTTTPPKMARTVLSPRAERLGDELVELDTAALDKAWQKDQSGYIGPEEAGIEGRREAARKFQAENEVGEAAEVSVDPQGKVTFTNGRHRVAELREAGVPRQSVAMTPESRLNAQRTGLIPREVVETPFDPNIVDIPEGTKAYKVRAGSATATVAETAELVKLKDIVSTREAGGDGTAVIDALKAKGKPIELFVGQGGRGYSDPAKLKDWYAKRGFKPMDSSGDRLRWEPAKSPEVAESAILPTLRAGEKQGDLLSKQTEDLTLIGERQKVPAPQSAPAGKAPTVEQTAADAVRAYGDVAEAHKRLGEQMMGRDVDAPTKARLKAAQRQLEVLAEREYRRGALEDLDSAMSDKHELLQSVRELGGLPTLTGKGAESAGELGRIIETKKGTFLSLFRKNAKSLDDLRQMLEDRGFRYETPYDMLAAIEDSISTGRKHFGTSEAGAFPFGPGKMTEGELAPQRTTGLKRAVVDTERLARGAEEIPTPERQREEIVVQDAENLVDANPAAAPALVDRILSGKTAITEKEAAMLLVERQRLMNERGEWQKIAGDENAAPAERAAAAERMQAFEGEFEKLDQAQRAVGTTWGRLGHMYQRLIQEDYTLAAMERRERASKGRSLTPDERAVIAEQAKNIEDLQKEVERGQHAETEAMELAEVARTYAETVKELRTELETRPAYGKDVFDIARGVVDRWKKDADEARIAWRKSFGNVNAIPIPTEAIVYLAKMIRAKVGEFGLNSAETLTALVAELGDDVRPYFSKAWEKAQKMIADEKLPPKVKERVKKGTKKKKAGEETPVDIGARAKAEALAEEPLSKGTVGELVRELIRSGIHGEDPVMAAAHKILKEAYPDLTERDVRRAYVDYGRAKFPSKDEVLNEDRELRTLVRLQESIARETEGLPALRTGIQRDRASQLIRDKQKQLNELLKARKGDPSPEQLASNQAARQTALRNRIEDLDRQLKTGEKPVKTATNPPDATTETLMAERDAMVEKLREIEALENPPPSPAEVQVKRLGEVKARLDDRLRGVTEAKPAEQFSALSVEAENLQAEIQAMRELQAQIRRDAKPPKDPEAVREKAQISAWEKAIKTYEEKLAAGDFSSQAGGKLADRPLTERAQRVRDLLDARRAAYDSAKKASQPVKTPEEIYNESRLKSLEKQIADTEARAAAGNFSRPVKPIPKAKTQAVIDAELKLAEAKRKIHKGWQEQELARRSVPKKILDGIKQTVGASTNIISSLDFSGFRQAFFATLSNVGRALVPLEAKYNVAGDLRPSVINPAKSARLIFGPAGKMFSGWLTEKRAQEIELARTKRPNAQSGAYKEMGIEFSALNTEKFTKFEENAHSVLDDWAELPLRTGDAVKDAATLVPKLGAKAVRMSNRAFISLLNETRADLADYLLDTNFRDRAPTPADLKVIGNYVNIATGRGKLNPKVASVAGNVFWAPSLFTSRVQALTGQPLWTTQTAFKGSGRARAVVAQEYARTIISGYLLWKSAQLFNQKKEDDPTSSDFGKIVRGNTRIDPWAGHQQVLVAVSRAASGKTTGVDDKARKSDLGSLIMNFGRGKLRPDWGALWNSYDIAFDQVKPGHPTNFGQVAAGAVLPMSLGDIVKIMRDRGFSEGMIVEALGVFGAGINVYGQKEAQK